MKRSRLSETKTPAYNTVPLREQQLAQFHMGKAKARVEAARDTLYRAAEEASDDVAQSTALLSVASKIRLQLAVLFCRRDLCRSRPIGERYCRDILHPLGIPLRTSFP